MRITHTSTTRDFHTSTTLEVKREEAGAELEELHIEWLASQKVLGIFKGKLALAQRIYDAKMKRVA